MMKSLVRIMAYPIIWVSLLCAVALGYSWMSPEISAPNERSRLYLTLSIIESGTLRIDGPVKKYGKHFDLASRDGHYYSDKAPASSIIAIPAIWAYKAGGGQTQ